MMTIEQYRDAKGGLTKRPPQHAKINGRTIRSLQDLEFVCEVEGFEPPVEVDELLAALSQPNDRQEGGAGEAQGYQEPAKAPEKPAPKKAPSKPATTATTKKPASKAAPKKPAAKPAKNGQPEIPEDLETLNYAQQQELAKALDIEPVPTVASDLIAAIEAKRA